MEEEICYKTITLHNCKRGWERKDQKESWKIRRKKRNIQTRPALRVGTHRIDDGEVYGIKTHTYIHMYILNMCIKHIRVYVYTWLYTSFKHILHRNTFYILKVYLYIYMYV